MRVRFQADADLNEEIVAGAIRREPGIDFKTAEEANLRGVPDPEVLAQAATENRIVVTHDRRTMPHHFGAFVLQQTSAGVLIVSQQMAVRDAIDELLLVWSASESEEWTNRIAELPL